MSVKDIKLPELGEGVHEGEIVKWLVKTGDRVIVDQPVVEIMTDKATIEVPTPTAGVVKNLNFKSGDVVKVDSVLMQIDEVIAKLSSINEMVERSKKQEPSAITIAENEAGVKSAESIKLVKLPELGEGVHEGEVVKWLIKVGDKVAVDQPIIEIMTDKASVEVPSPYTGEVLELLSTPGQVVKVDQALIKVRTNTEVKLDLGQIKKPEVTRESAPAGASRKFENSVSQSLAGSAVNFIPPAELRVLATPGTRRLAREMNVDINNLLGTGLAGRVTREDILSYKGSGPVAAVMPGVLIGRDRSDSNSIGLGPLEERVPMRGIRKKIAENMQIAKSIIPHFTLMDEAEVTDLVSIRESLKPYAEKQNIKVTYLPFVMKALIATIREFVMFNASIDDKAQEIVYKKFYNLGFAADTPTGLVVPVIKNADQKSIFQLSREILDLSMRAREGKLKLDEMKGATITITNIGSVGGTYATPIINHPEVAILGMYKMTDKPVWKNGTWVPVKVMNFTITADHRLIDGAVAANFLKAFIQRIQSPSLLMAEMV